MRRWAVVVAIAVAAAASPVLAADDPAQPPATTQGPMAIERVTNGWLIAPDVMIGRVGSTTTTMAGAYGGYMFDHLLVGGAGSWQVNRSVSRTIDYGGAIVEWLARTDRPVGFGARALVGGGRGSINASLAGLPIEGGRDDRFFVHDPFFGHLIPVDLPVPVRLRDVRFTTDFAIFEPQADVLVNISPRLRVRAAAGYRFIGASRGWSSLLRGPSGSVGLQIGGATTRRAAP